MRNERKFFFSSIARLHKTETFKLVFHHALAVVFKRLFILFFFMLLDTQKEGGMAVYGIDLFPKRYFGNCDFNVWYCGII